jgi:hypothetical protein
MHKIASFFSPLSCFGILRLVCKKWSSVRAIQSWIGGSFFDGKLSRHVGLRNLDRFFVASDIRGFETTLTNEAEEDTLTRFTTQLPCLSQLALKCVYLSAAEPFWSAWPTLRELYLDTTYLSRCRFEEGAKLPDLTHLTHLTLVSYVTTALDYNNRMEKQFGLIARCFVEATSNLTRLSIQSAFNYDAPGTHENEIVQAINTRHTTRFDMLELPRGWMQNNKLTVTCRVLILQCFYSSQEFQRRRQASCSDFSPDFSRINTDELTVQGSNFLSEPEVRLPRGLKVLRWDHASRAFFTYIDSQFAFHANLFAECHDSLKVLDFRYKGFDREVLKFDLTCLGRLQCLEHVHTNQWTQRHLKLLFDCLGPQTVVHVKNTRLCTDLIADILDSRIKGFQGSILLGLCFSRKTLIQRERERLQSRGYTWEYFQLAFSIEWQDTDDHVARIVFSRELV